MIDSVIRLKNRPRKPLNLTMMRELKILAKIWLLKLFSFGILRNFAFESDCSRPLSARRHKPLH